MKINWKAAIIGGVAFWILALIFQTAGGLAGWGSVIAVLIGGIVAVWQAKDKKPADGATTGLVAGVLGAIITIIISFTGFTSLQGAWPYPLAGAIADWIIWGLIFGAIGGAIMTMIKK